MEKKYASNTARQAAYRERLKLQLDKLKARISELEAELARGSTPRTAADWEAVRQAAAEQRKAKLAAAKAASMPPPAPDETIDTVRAELIALKEQYARTLTANRNLRRRLDYQSAAMRESTLMTKKVYRDIKACLHPDRSVTEARLTRAFQAFAKLKIRIVDVDAD